MKDDKYTPDQIPEQVQETVFTHYCIAGYDYGKLKHYTFDASGEQYVLIAKTPITIDIPPVGDLKTKVIDALETEKKKQQAEHHKKMFELQEKIDSLLCLEYKPAAPIIEETSNVIPF